MQKDRRSFLKKLSLIVPAALTGCDGGGGSGSSMGVQTPSPSPAPSSPSPAPAPTPGPVPPSSSGRFRLISVASDANPFLGPGDGADFGGSKHVMWSWHPLKKRVYTWGGDYGNGARNFGQPNMGATFTAGNGNSYTRDSSLNNDQYSIDPYASGQARWRLEHPYIPRMIGGARESRPGRPDQVSLIWDPTRNKFWAIITVLRTEFLYRDASGAPDLWANGDMTTTDPVEPTGTWSWIPSESGGAGTWTLETTARVAYRRDAAGTSYSGNVLLTNSGDERIAYWERDPVRDKILAFGTGRIFIFDPVTMSYQHRVFTPAGYGYFNPCSSQVAIVDDWMYGVALTNQGGTRRSQLIRVNIPSLLALSNGAAIPDNSGSWEGIPLPWSLSPGSVWETNDDASSKWQEHAGVLALDRKVVIIKSYDGLLEDNVTKLAIWSPDSRAFTASDPAPEDIGANSWVALPDSGEVMFGLNTVGYPNGRLWAYKVR